MAVTELPFGSMVTANHFLVGDHTKRSAWITSFFIPATANDGYVLFCGPGAVTVGSNTITLGPPGSDASNAILAGGQFAGTGTSLQQVYVDSSGNAQCVQVSSTSVSFPAGSLALCFLQLDKVGRIQQIIDQRTSYLSSVPSFGGGTESISDATKRVYFQNNYAVPRTAALTPQIPQDLSLPAPGFFLGSGAVVISGNTISTPAKYYSTATNAAGDGWGLLFINAITQIFVSPSTGQVSTQIPATSGVFPANSLAVAEVTTDATGQIRSLVDWRPSYI